MKTSFAVSFLCFALSAGTFPAHAETSKTLTDEQLGQMAERYFEQHPDKLGRIMATWLSEHPEFLVTASQNLQQKQEMEQRRVMQSLAWKERATLLDPATPSVGPKDAKVALVMFFDYQCIYCSKINPVLEQVIKANPKVRFVFKDFPIFASRWPVSGYAAAVGETIWRQKGAQAYLAYHNAVFSTGKNEGALTAQDVNQAADKWLSAQQRKTVDKAQPAIQANMDLGQRLQIAGTPAFIIMPQNAGDAQAVTVIPGSTTQDILQKAISQAEKG